MAEVNVSSVQPSEVSREMVAYLLTASILSRSSHQGYVSCQGLPIILGSDKETILATVAECIRTVTHQMSETERSERARR